MEMTLIMIVCRMSLPRIRVSESTVTESVPRIRQRDDTLYRMQSWTWQDSEYFETELRSDA